MSSRHFPEIVAGRVEEYRSGNGPGGTIVTMMIALIGRLIHCDIRNDHSIDLCSNRVFGDGKKRDDRSSVREKHAASLPQP